MNIFSCRGYVELKDYEYRILREIPYSLSIRGLAKRANVPYATVYRFLQSFMEHGRIYFVPKYENLGLVDCIFFTSPDPIEKLPVYTINSRQAYTANSPIRVVRALLPPHLIPRYKKELDLDIYEEVLGWETIYYRINSPRTLYIKNVVLPMFTLPDPVETRPVLKWNPPSKVPDPIDLALVAGKLAWSPLLPPSEVYNRVKSYIPELPDISPQLLSYHYRTHVTKRLWKYNGVGFFFNSAVVPFRYYFFKGRDAHIVARILIDLPFFTLALIDEGKSVVVGQLPCSYLSQFYRLISSFDIEMPFGEIVMGSRNYGQWIPPLPLLVEDGRWVWREIEYVVAEGA